MAKVYSWEVKKSPKTYAYIVSPKDYNLAYIGTELKGTSLQKVIDWASTCTDTEYEAQFNKMVALCEEKGYNVNFETVEAYIDVRSSCDNLRGPAGRGIDYISLTSTNNVTRENTYTIYYDDGETDTFTIQNGIDGRDGIDGKPGAKGDEGVSTRFIMVYTSGRDENGEIVKPSRPEGGSYDFLTNKATYPDGWDPNDSDKLPPIWMSSRVFGSTEASTDKNWSEPVQISGDNGEPGVDGVSTEFIYYLSNVKPTNVDSLPSLNVSGYCPTEYGWTASPKGIDEDNHTEWCCIRNYNKENQSWGAWEGPTIWSKYGVNGQDGDGVQYIYIKTETPTPPKNPTPYGYKTTGSQYYGEYQDKNKEWIPKQDTKYTNYIGDEVEFIPIYEEEEGISPAGVWFDNPVDVSNKFKYQWVSTRKYQSDESGKKYWTEYSNPALWGKFGDDGKSGTSIRKIYALSESTSNPPDLPGSSTITGDWGTGFPRDYVAGKYVVWCSEAEIWAHNFEFVKSYKKVSTVDSEGNVIAPSDYLNNFIEVDYIPDEKYNEYKYLKLSSDGHFYEWMGGWCEPYIITGLKGEDGNPIDYTTYVFGYGLADYEPQPPTGNTPDKPGASTDEVGTTIIWKEYPDTSEAFLDDEGNFIYNPDGSVVRKVDGYKDSKGRVWRWYQCCGHVDGRLKTVEWGAVFTCSGKDGETLPGKYVEFRFGVTLDDIFPTLNSIDINGEPIRNPLLHDKYGHERGWYTTSQQIVIPKGGAMYQIWATIDGATDKVELVNGIGWNGPIRVSGEKGEQGLQGPTGLRGITGIPGAKMESMYCLGTDENDGYFGGDTWKEISSIEEMIEDGWLSGNNMPFSDCIDIYDQKELITVAAAEGNEGRVIRLTKINTDNINGSTFTTKKLDYYLVKKGTPVLLKENVGEDEDYFIYVWCVQGSEVWQNGVLEKYIEVVNYADENNSLIVAELPGDEYTDYTYLICKNRFYVWESYEGGGAYIEVNSLMTPTYVAKENTKKVDELPTVKDNLFDFLVYNGKYYQWMAINGDEVEHKLSGVKWSNPFRLQGGNLRGLAGNRGQVIYPKGIYSNEEVYITTADKAPYVYDPNDGLFYVYDIVGQPWVGIRPENYQTIKNPDGTYKYSIDGTGNEFTWIGDQQGDTPSNNYANAINENRKPAWVRFESFEALYTSIGIIANGLVGSAVFNNEFMFSQQGIDKNGTKTDYAIISGTNTTYGFLSGYEYDNAGKEVNGEILHWKYKNRNDYIKDTNVNPYEKDPSGNYIHTFMPNVCINFATGQMWLSTGKISFGQLSANISTTEEMEKYIQDINKTLEDYLDENLNNIQEQVDKSAGTYYGPNDPSINWHTNKDGEVSTYAVNRLGDLWFDTTVYKSYIFSIKEDNSKNYKSSKNQDLSGYCWQESDVPDTVYNRINTRSKIFISKPNPPYYIGDLWFLENDSYDKEYFYDGDDLVTGFKKGVCLVCINDSETEFSYKHWGRRDKYADEADVANAEKELSIMKEKLDDWNDDGLLSPIEIKVLNSEYDTIKAEFNSIVSQAEDVGIKEGSDCQTYISTYNTLKNVLEGYYLNPVYAVNGSGKDSVLIILGNDKNKGYSWIQQYYEDRQKLLKAISSKINKETGSIREVIAEFKDDNSKIINTIQSDINGLKTATTGIVTSTNFQNIFKDYFPNVPTDYTAFSGMFANAMTDKGVITSANIMAYIKDGVSNVEISADKIKLEGYITANTNFQITEAGDIVAKAGTIGDFTLKDGKLVVEEDYFACELTKNGVYNRFRTNASGVPQVYSRFGNTAIGYGTETESWFPDRTFFNPLRIVDNRSVVPDGDFPMLGIAINGNGKDIGTYITGVGSNFILSGMMTEIWGLTLKKDWWNTSATLNPNIDIVVFNNTSDITVNMPSAKVGKVLFLKRTTSSKVTLKGHFRGKSSLDGTMSTTLSVGNDSLILIYTDLYWTVF